MITIGDLTAHVINDCTTRMDGGGPFGLVPTALWRDLLPPDADHRVPMTHHVLYLRVGEAHVLIDTGYGDKLIPKQQALLAMERPGGGLVGGLTRLGVTPDQITHVLLTHLHGDHVGGATRYDADGALALTFPNARHYVQRREYEDAQRPNERTRATYLRENIDPLVEKDALVLLDGDTDILPGVQGVVTPGHTPGHMSIVIESGGAHLLFICDLASFAHHLERLGWMTAYDVEPLVTLETKRRWADWAVRTGATIVFAHDIQRPVGKLVADAAGRRRVVAIPTPIT